MVRWAAGLTGKAEQDPEDYQGTIISLALKTGSDATLVERVSLDFAMAGAAVSQQQVRTRLEAFRTEAKQNSA